MRYFDSIFIAEISGKNYFRDKMSDENRCQICGLKVASRIQLLRHYYVHLLLVQFQRQKSPLADFVENLKSPDWTKYDLKRELFLEKMSAAWVHLKNIEINENMQKELNTTLRRFSNTTVLNLAVWFKVMKFHSFWIN